MRIQANNRIGLLNLDEAADVARLHGLQCLDHLGRQLVGGNHFVVAHVYPKVVVGNLLRQQAELLVALGGLGLFQSIVGLLLSFLGLIGGCGPRRQDGNGLEGVRLRNLVLGGILVVIGLYLGWRDCRLVVHFLFQQLVDQQRTLDLVAQLLARTMHLRLHELLKLFRVVETFFIG